MTSPPNFPYAEGQTQHYGTSRTSTTTSTGLLGVWTVQVEKAMTLQQLGQCYDTNSLRCYLLLPLWSDVTVRPLSSEPEVLSYGQNR